jgi:hypothetical protein
MRCYCEEFQDAKRRVFGTAPNGLLTRSAAWVFTLQCGRDQPPVKLALDLEPLPWRCLVVGQHQ